MIKSDTLENDLLEQLESENMYDLIERAFGREVCVRAHTYKVLYAILRENLPNAVSSLPGIYRRGDAQPIATTGPDDGYYRFDEVCKLFVEHGENWRQFPPPEHNSASEMIATGGVYVHKKTSKPLDLSNPRIVHYDQPYNTIYHHTIAENLIKRKLVDYYQATVWNTDETITAEDMVENLDMSDAAKRLATAALVGLISQVAPSNSQHELCVYKIHFEHKSETFFLSRGDDYHKLKYEQMLIDKHLIPDEY